MAKKKEIAILKRAKISEAQQYVLLAVLGAAIFLGAAIALVMHFTKKISFNIGVIAEEERAIVKYSDTIKNIGICTAPAGTVYTDAELDACTPDDISISAIPGTLRANIIENMAANQALNSVPKESNSDCINALTGKAYTYKEMQDYYNDATTTEARVAASQLIKSCSALRIIPDALPSSKNEEALLASLNKIFNISNWVPESISPAGDSESLGTDDSGLNPISVSLSVEADSGTTMAVLSNIERSIREFNFSRATIEWREGNSLMLESVATAYYANKSTLTETTKEIKPGEAIEDTNASEEDNITEGEIEE